MSFAILFAPRIETYADLQCAAMSSRQRRWDAGSGRRRRARRHLRVFALVSLTALTTGSFLLSGIKLTYEGGREPTEQSTMHPGGSTTLGAEDPR